MLTSSVFLSGCSCSSGILSHRQIFRAQQQLHRSARCTLLPLLPSRSSGCRWNRCGHHKQTSSVHCNAISTVREQATGVEFPSVAQFWEGEPFRSLGAAVRQKKIAFVGVKVYAITLYVEADKAARELGVRKRGGFFQDAGTEEYADAIVDGAFSKLLQVQLVRNVDGETFFGALQEALEPRLRLSGDMKPLEEMKAFFAGQNFQKGMNILLLARPEGILEFVTGQAGTSFAQARPSLRIESATLCRALLEVYLGGAAVIPDAREAWAKGARALMESEEDRRSDRKGGSG
ncbi:hypothetical protein WJX84_006743 [Apatococcus fuscideae]|uniref:Chalcone-flavonone isomerase family protein n=1 Tax=Apatococcus fuscideae TaxID=2026836 RepID=A0AAW1T7P3_9CHLO